MLLPLLGCVAAGPADTAALVPSPWSWEEAAEVPTPYDVATVELAVEDLAARVWSIDPRAPWDVNDALIAEGDGACPAVGVHNGLSFVTGDCVATGGNGYYGFVQYTKLNDFYYNGGLWNEEFRWITGTFRVTEPDGGTYVTEGEIEFHDYLGEDQHQGWSARMLGDFHYTAAENGWMTEDISVFLNLDAHVAGAPVDNGRQVWLDGSIARLSGAFDAVDFDDLTMPGEACAAEPDGDLWLHDDQGLWYLVQFDEVCDGCGTLIANRGTPAEVDMGPICPELEPLRVWEGEPWSR